MRNELELEPWVIAKQLRHGDDGTLVVKLYGHPTREKAIERIRRAMGTIARVRAGLGGFSGDSCGRSPVDAAMSAESNLLPPSVGPALRGLSSCDEFRPPAGSNAW
jgi:hypothetical protein